jgi:electron-transferring-flavoprotein dehydrogenase
VVVGDAAGFVDVPSLKGVHYALQSGIYAARAIFAALKAGDTSAAGLAEYDRQIDASYIVRDMHRTRNMRLAFKDGFWPGAVKAGLMTVTGGRVPGGRIPMDADVAAPPCGPAGGAAHPDGRLTISKLDAVFRPGTRRGTTSSHLIPAELVDRATASSTPGCVRPACTNGRDGAFASTRRTADCKATDVLDRAGRRAKGGAGRRIRGCEKSHGRTGGRETLGGP